MVWLLLESRLAGRKPSERQFIDWPRGDAYRRPGIPQLMNLPSSAWLSPVPQLGACWFVASSGLDFPARTKPPGDQVRSFRSGTHLPAA